MNRVKGFSLVALASLLIAPALCAADAPVRLAILSGEGERAPAPEAVAQIEAGLTGMKDVTLLERAEVRKILAEQELSAAGLDDPRTAIKLGKILSVEMFFFLERVPKTNPPVCRAEAIDSATGMVLAGGLAQESKLDTPQVQSWLHQALQKQETPPRDRRYVGILGIQSEAPDPGLDSIARGLGMFLSADLQACPTVIPLDREHLDWLRREKSLTGMDQALSASTVLIQGGLRRNQGKVELTLELEPLGGGEPQRISLQFAPDALAAFRKELLGAIAARLKLKPPTAEKDAAQEGKSFLAEARVLDAADMKDDYLRAAEAAYALAPGRETRYELAFAYKKQTLYGNASRNFSVVLSGGEGRLFDTAPEEEQVRSLQFEKQMLRLLCEQFQLDSDQGYAPPGTPPSGDRETFAEEQNAVMTAPGIGVVTQRAKGEAEALLPEVAALQRKYFDLIAAAAKKNPKVYRWHSWAALHSAMARLWLGNLYFWKILDSAPAQAEGLAKVIGCWRDAAAMRDAPDYRDFGCSLMYHIMSLGDLPEDVRMRFRPAFDRVADDADPLVRLVDLFGLCTVDPDASRAEDILKCLRDDISLKDTGQPSTFGPDNLFASALGNAATKAISVLQQKNPALAARYCEEIMGPWMKEGGKSWRVCAWSEIFKPWGEAVEQSRGKEQAAALYGRIAAALRDCMTRWPHYEPIMVRRQIQTVQSLQAALGPAPAKPSPAEDPWKAYEIRPLGLQLNGFLKAMSARGDRVYCLMGSRVGLNTVRLTASVHKFPEGGPALRTWTLDVQDSAVQVNYPMFPAVAADHLYIGVKGGLLVCSDSEPLRLLTEADGLPGEDISALAEYGGKLYMGLGEQPYQGRHAFAVYDPHTRANRIIVSTTSIEPERRIDLAVESILPDEERKCLWLSGTGGLHRYTPATDKLDAPIKSDGADPFWLWPLTFCPGGLCGGGVLLHFVNLQTFQTTVLLALPNTMFNGVPVFGCPMFNGLSPAWYDGSTLITSDYESERFPSRNPKPPEDFLCLYRPGKAPASMRTPRPFCDFTPTPCGLLVGQEHEAWKAEGYLIVRKTLPDPAGAPGAPAKEETAH